MLGCSATGSQPLWPSFIMVSNASLPSIDELIERFKLHGHLRYAGEDVTQLQHGWQCGRLAQRAKATPALQLAAWLHDVGHLFSGRGGSPTLEGHDDQHERVAAQLLEPVFGAAVARPVALHVAAKRYLVAMRPGYASTLSPDSVRSLALQGGAMSQAEARQFIELPFAQDAVRLRAWDDAGKLGEWTPASVEDALAHLRELMHQVVQTPQAGEAALRGR